jgi:hypothetical protein
MDEELAETLAEKSDMKMVSTMGLTTEMTRGCMMAD